MDKIDISPSILSFENIKIYFKTITKKNIFYVFVFVFSTKLVYFISLFIYVRSVMRPDAN